MIKSMTAFARKDLQAEWGNLTCEVRTVNHRYLEAGFRLPEPLRDLEVPLRDQLREFARRGKVDVGMRLQLVEKLDSGFTVNMAAAEALNDAANQVNRMLDNPAHINALDILRWPGVLEPTRQDLEQVKKAAVGLFRDTMEEVARVREREGERLMPLFRERLDSIETLVARVRKRMPELLERQKAQISERFAEAQVSVDPDRLAQEMVIIAQKSDVAEELDRLEAHVQEVREALQRDESLGRRLDFLMQELNREANTLSSKSLDAGITQVAVELKVLIEQMREQVQNVE